jgi:tetratricopeptide (TPR) repeat protein
VTPDNPVVKLCTAGMAAEGEGRGADAKALFEQAWDASRDDFEACIAAHYVARHQATAEATFEWNERALQRAEAGDDRARDFFPSLYLNYAHSLEQIGRTAEASEHYARAALHVEQLPDSPYKQLVRSGIVAGQARTCRI